ncbi:MAG: hypothetical protein IKK70_05225 [Clostridia bacterium]|nr:hypothetical protein [Clostridia bacterium]
MGFGIALFGYACLLMIGIGGELFAALLLAYGFFLASRLDKDFLHAAISALFILPSGILNICEIVGIIDSTTSRIYPYLNAITFFLFLGAWLMMTFYWLSAVIRIAKEGSAPKLERQARYRLVATAVYILLVVAVYALKSMNLLGAVAGSAEQLIFILQYVVIFYNLFFLHTCFILITSEKQYEKDKQAIAREQAEALEKMHKERQETMEKLKKHNKK